MANRKQENRRTPADPKGIIGLLLFLLLGFGIYMFVNPGRPGVFTYYAGPILPLTSLSGGEDVTVERNVTMDFVAYAAPELRDYERTVAVTDTYVLTNPTDENVTVELAWGFEGQFCDDRSQFPAITLDGAPMEAAMYPATDNDDLVKNAFSFDKYKKVLTENDFLADALAETPVWDVPVKVYHFYDLAYTGEEITGKAYLDIAYEMGSDTTLWVRDYSSAGTADGKFHLKFNVDRGEVWLYIVGEDLEEMEVSGSRGINVSIDAVHSETLEGVQWELETYESTFMECLRTCAREYVYDPSWSDRDQPVELVTPELLYDGAMKQIVGTSLQDAAISVRSVDSLFGDVTSDIRMLYFVFPVEIPAGGSVTVSGQYNQESSQNFDATLHGCDMATTLGSNLTFTSQTATIQNADLITIADDGNAQNFGFDPTEGITTVTLDSETERYFIDIIPVA